MRRVEIPIGVAVLLCLLLPGRPSAQGADDQAIWRNFVASMKTGTIAASDIRPMVPGTGEAMLDFVKQMQSNASWKEWEARPEVYHVGSVVHFVLPLTFGGGRHDYCFSFIAENGRHLLHHFESIVLRLDRTGPLPTSSFPDVPEEQKAFMRQESYWTTMVWLSRTLNESKWKDAAAGLFRDGPGYVLAARAWVPFYEVSKAFILYLCWEQSRLQGNAVTLEELSDKQAVVTLDPIFLALYVQSSHLRTQIAEADYRRLFETMWRDRATEAGWNLRFDYVSPTRCTLRFTRSST